MLDGIEEIFLGPKSLDIGRGIATKDLQDPASIPERFLAPCQVPFPYE